MDSFKAFELDMLERINSILQPIVTWLEEISDNLREVEKTADAAMEMGLLSQEDIMSFGTHEQWATEKILFLEQKTQRNNSETERGSGKGEQCFFTFRLGIPLAPVSIGL